MKDIIASFSIGAANLACVAISYQGIVNMVTLIANALVALIGLGFGVYKVGRVVVNHFKDKHGDDCDCEQEINDIINKH